MNATISECGRYRYRLRREWLLAPGLVLESPECATFIMLNPSTANADVDDATIRKCVGFASRWGCHAIEVVNLFAFRATDPRDLRAADDPFGPDNTDALNAALSTAAGEHGPVVVAWGTQAKHVAARAQGGVVRVMAMRHFVELQCLGTNADGSPRHPLMLASRTPLEPWPEPFKLTAEGDS